MLTNFIKYNWIYIAGLTAFAACTPTTQPPAVPVSNVTDLSVCMTIQSYYQRDLNSYRVRNNFGGGYGAGMWGSGFGRGGIGVGVNYNLGSDYLVQNRGLQLIQANCVTDGDDIIFPTVSATAPAPTNTGRSVVQVGILNGHQAAKEVKAYFTGLGYDAKIRGLPYVGEKVTLRKLNVAEVSQAIKYAKDIGFKTPFQVQ